MSETISIRVQGHPNEFVTYDVTDPVAVAYLEEAAKVVTHEPFAVKPPRKYKDKR